jgi:hypothetical membrane protein
LSPEQAPFAPLGDAGNPNSPARAFPNAYLETDEPPRRSLFDTLLASLTIAGIGYLGLVILLLSLFTSEYSPITQVASDYGVGTYAVEMNAGFLLAGVGTISLALAGLLSLEGRSARAGSLLFLPAGASLIVNAFFSTDIEGAATTVHGTIHGLGGVVFFITAPVALLLVGHGLGRRRFALTLLAVALGVGALVLDSVMALDAAGFAERVLILVVFSCMILTAVRIRRGAWVPLGDLEGP